MADNPYTSQTLDSYNLNPPPDDGTTVSANQLTWLKHKEKLGDPLKNFSTAIDAAALAAGVLTVVNGSDQSNALAGSVGFTSSELTIVSGSVAAVRSHHTIDTESGAGTDDLDTITVAGVPDGCLLYLRLEDAARVVTIKDNTGNIQTKNNDDFVLTATFPAVFQRIGTDWFEIDRPDRSTFSIVDINGGAIDGTVIGGSTAATGSFTDLNANGNYVNPGQPAFAAFNSVTATGQTGNGTQVTVVCDTEEFDQGADYTASTGIFTAPVSGRYTFSASVLVGGITAAATDLNLFLITSNLNYILFENDGGGGPFTSAGGSATVDMDAADTASLRLQGSGEASDVMSILGNAAQGSTYFSGFLTA